jgi:uncharacterized protein YprB with RNaseH-like and TPR domain
MKRLFFDIETSPNIGFFWQSGYKLQVGYENIIEERRIITICYKWEGNDKVYSLTWDKEQNDKKMLKEFVRLAEKADEIVAHNGDRFDLPWIRTRCLFHRIPMMPEFTSVDTLKAAKGKFRFNSNRLDYIAKFLGEGAKNNHKGFDLWKDVMLKRSKSALKEMVDYCKNDVVILENVFHKLNEYLKQKTHRGVMETDHRWACPKCGGDEHIHVNKTRVSAAGIKKFDMVHGKNGEGCGHKWIVSASVHRKMLEYRLNLKLRKLD